jgi:glycerol uptake facilitator protein
MAHDAPASPRELAPGLLVRECAGELIGTFILVFFGVGSVQAAVLTGAQSGLWQVAVVWGVAIALAIYATRDLSGTHINPAITAAFAVYRGFPWRKAPAYVGAQLAGAFLAAWLLHGLFGGALAGFEAAHDIAREGAGGRLSAMCFGEYFPNPAIAAARGWTDGVVSHGQAMLAEAVGTAFLAFVVLAVTDGWNVGGPGHRLAPVFIGLTVSIVISVLGPLTQAGLNPARDFGPRLYSLLIGYGRNAVPGPRGGFFTVYILSPILGALVGGGVYQFIVRPGLPAGRLQHDDLEHEQI